MQLFNVTLHQNSKWNLVLYNLDWLFKLKTHELQKSLKRWFVKYTQKQFYKMYVVTVNKHYILSKTKKVTTVLEIFSFLAMVNQIQCCTNFNLLNLMLHFALPSFSLFSSASFNFQALFLLFLRSKHCKKQFSYIQCSVLIALLFQHSSFIHGTVFIHWKQCILC